MTSLILTPVQARIAAALVEKSISTPQYYPMTVNAVTSAANQKTAREPVMTLREGEVGAALGQLAELGLTVRDDAGGRVPKWRHRLHHQLLLKPAALAVLGTLMLRDQQTAAELRANAAGLGGPTDVEGVLAVLEDLADRVQPLVKLLPRAAGQSTPRYAHLLCGEPEVGAVATLARAENGSVSARLSALEERVAALERRLGPSAGPDAA